MLPASQPLCCYDEDALLIAVPRANYYHPLSYDIYCHGRRNYYDDQSRQEKRLQLPSPQPLRLLSREA